MASRSAAWVFGGVRLISSASSSSQKIGPLTKVKALAWKLNRLAPRMSPGIRSGVNWIRPKLRASVRAKHWARKVLAVPGGPSRRMCPPAKSAVSIRSTVSAWPTIALATSARMASARARTSATFTGHLQSPLIESLGEPHEALPVLHLRGLACERGYAARADPLAKLVGVAVEVRGGQTAGPKRLHNLRPIELEIAAGHARLAMRHTDQAGRVLRQRPLAQRERAACPFRCAEPIGRVQRHQQRRARQAERRAQKGRGERELEQVGRVLVAVQADVEDH